MKNLIDAIENEIYTQTCEAIDNGEEKPKFKIVFSNEGYTRARHEPRTACYFNMNLPTFLGYPFYVDEHQVQTFTIEQLDG